MTNITGPESVASELSVYASVGAQAGDVAATPHLFRELVLSGDAAFPGKWVVQDVYSYPVYTLIVFLNEGRVESIQWDEGCFFCSGGVTAPCRYSSLNTTANATFEVSGYQACASDETVCDQEEGACDLKLYITWTGTDSQGVYLESANLRFSRFRSFGLPGILDATQRAAEGGANDASKAGQAAENIPKAGGVVS